MAIVQIMQFATERSCAAVARSASFPRSTKNDTRICGNGGIVCTALAATQSTVVIQNPSTNASRTRAKFRAPQLYPKIG